MSPAEAADPWAEPDELYDARVRLEGRFRPQKPPADAFVYLEASRKRLPSSDLGLEYIEVEAHGNRAIVDEEWVRREYKRLRTRCNRQKRAAAARKRREAREAQRMIARMWTDLEAGNTIVLDPGSPRWSTADEDEIWGTPPRTNPQNDDNDSWGWSESSVPIEDNALTRAKVDELDMGKGKGKERTWSDSDTDEE